MAMIGMLLVVVGAVGAIGSILVGGPVFGGWTLSVSVAFVIVAVIGLLLVGNRRT